MRRPILTASLALAAALLGASCKDGTGPESVNGRYTLRLIEGQPLPLLVRESRTTEPATMREYIDGATLVLLEPERDTLRIMRRIVTIPDGGSATTVSGPELVPWYFDDDRMCPSDAYPYYHLEGGCPGRPTVPRRGDSLFIEMPVIATQPSQTFTFVREGR